MASEIKIDQSTINAFIELCAKDVGILKKNDPAPAKLLETIRIKYHKRIKSSESSEASAAYKKALKEKARFVQSRYDIILALIQSNCEPSSEVTEAFQKAGFFDKESGSISLDVPGSPGRPRGGSQSGA